MQARLVGNLASSVWRSVGKARPGGGSGVLVEGRGVSRVRDEECERENLKVHKVAYV